jgi:hypothetical protein
MNRLMLECFVACQEWSNNGDRTMDIGRQKRKSIRGIRLNCFFVCLYVRYEYLYCYVPTAPGPNRDPSWMTV